MLTILLELTIAENNYFGQLIAWAEGHLVPNKFSHGHSKILTLKFRLVKWFRKRQRDSVSHSENISLGTYIPRMNRGTKIVSLSRTTGS